MALGNKTLDDLLGPISKQLEHTGVADSVEMPEWEFKAQRVTDGLSASQLVDLFESEAAKIRVQTKRCAKGDVAKAIAEIVAQGEPESGKACSVVCADEPLFADGGLYDALRACDKVTDVHVWDPASDANVQKARVATYGVTYATAGIAESATVVQPTSPTCGRAVSLLPLVHIAVVDASAIQPTMLEVMQSYAASGSKLPSQVCFISGPSATADIELVRVEGVHGPMYVHYVIAE